MPIKKFMKEKASLIALFLMLITGPMLMMTACKSTVNPSSPGIATATKTFTSTPIITNTPTMTPTTPANATATPTPPTFGNPNSIAIIGWARNGDAEVGFVNATTSNISSGTVLYFTNQPWDSTANSGAGGLSDQSVTTTGAVTEVENVVSYTVGAGGLAPFTPVYFGNPSNMTDSLQGGTLANVYAGNGSGTAETGTTSAAVTYLPESGNGNGGDVLVYYVPSAGTTVFLTALNFSANAFKTGSAISSYNTTDYPTGFSASNTLDLAPLWNNNLTANNAAALTDNECAVLSNCVTASWAIVTGSNWTEEISSKTKLLMPSTGLTTCGGLSQVGFTFNATQTATELPY